MDSAYVVEAPLVRLLWFVAFSAEMAPDEAALRAKAAAWMLTNLPPERRDALVAIVNSGDVRFVVLPRAESGLPPRSTYERAGLSTLDGHKLDVATHVVAVLTGDWLGPARVGLWASMAATQAMVAELDGVWVDTELDRVIPAKTRFRSGGFPGVASLVQVAVARAPQGRRWLATRGMARFGLPELSLGNVAPHQAQLAVAFVNGVAQAAAEAVALGFHEAPKGPMHLPSVLTVARSHVARAGGDAAPQDDAVVRVKLTYTPGEPSLLSLGPETGDAAVWLEETLITLFADADERALWEAAVQARRELPGIEYRFKSGLPSGSTLYLKAGFPLDGGGRAFWWVAVGFWDNGHIVGLLSEETEGAAGYRAGGRVECAASDVVDWLIAHADGRLEGARVAEIAKGTV